MSVRLPSTVSLVIWFPHKNARTPPPPIIVLWTCVMFSSRYVQDNDVCLHKHCNVVLKNIAKFHALSLLLAKISRETLSDIFPFAVEAEGFRQFYLSRVLPVSERLAEYLRWDLREEQRQQFLQEKIEKLFWKLLEDKAKPSDPSKEVLIHGNLNFHNIMFR